MDWMCEGYRDEQSPGSSSWRPLRREGELGTDVEAESAALGSLRPLRGHLKEVMVNEKVTQEKEQGRVGLWGSHLH